MSPMDTTRDSGGRQHITLGPIERWIAVTIASLFIAGGIWFGRSLTDRLDQHNKTLQSVVTQQAVTNGKVDTLTQQLTDVPRLAREMAETRVRVDRHEQDIRELQRSHRP